MHYYNTTLYIIMNLIQHTNSSKFLINIESFDFLEIALSFIWLKYMYMKKDKLVSMNSRSQTLDVQTDTKWHLKALHTRKVTLSLNLEYTDIKLLKPRETTLTISPYRIRGGGWKCSLWFLSEAHFEYAHF